MASFEGYDLSQFPINDMDKLFFESTDKEKEIFPEKTPEEREEIIKNTICLHFKKVSAQLNEDVSAVFQEETNNNGQNFIYSNGGIQS